MSEEQKEIPVEKSFRFIKEYEEDGVTPKSFEVVKESEMSMEQHEQLGISLWSNFHKVTTIAQTMFLENLTNYLRAEKEVDEELNPPQQPGKIILLNGDQP